MLMSTKLLLLSRSYIISLFFFFRFSLDSARLVKWAVRCVFKLDSFSVHRFNVYNHALF